MRKLQVIIPMAGSGQRFTEAGVEQIKPLILVDQRPMIEYVVGLFSRTCDFVFICRQEHLIETNLRNVLEELAPQAKIIPIEKHNLGPVWSIKMAQDHIDLNLETIVCYCDFSFLWDFNLFLNTVAEKKIDGAIVCYRGFHPHMLGKTQYAFIRHEQMQVLEVREKQPFTTNRIDEFASNGLYYFRTGNLLIESVESLIAKNQRVNGEFYVSLCFNILTELGHLSIVYEVDNMLQWGTPEDLAHYQYWSDTFAKIPDSTLHNLSLDKTMTLLLLSGEGMRFRSPEYLEKKPFIKVNGQAMYISALNYIPKTEGRVLIANQKDRESLAQSDNHRVRFISETTNGQASSAILGLEDITHDDRLLIASCDLGMIAQKEHLRILMQEHEFDIVCFTTKAEQQHYRNENSYGWITLDGQRVSAVGVKERCKSDEEDYIICGTFIFKDKRLFERLYQEMISQKLLVNNEYYIDTMVKIAVSQGLQVYSLILEACLNWGTPEDLKIYQYWQSLFNRKSDHKYSIDRDPFFRETND